LLIRVGKVYSGLVALNTTSSHCFSRDNSRSTVHNEKLPGVWIMSRIQFWVATGILGLGCSLIPIAQSQTVVGKARPTPKLDPVAETKLLMDGLAEPNLRSLGKLLRDKPKEGEAWNFARGQALLIGETGNLLMMRPPRTPAGQDAWMANAVDLRDSGANLARLLATKDYTKSRAALANLANVCNHCHQAFQVQSRIDPFGEE
jgi:hypothetical protein